MFKRKFLSKPTGYNESKFKVVVLFCAILCLFVQYVLSEVFKFFSLYPFYVRWSLFSHLFSRFSSLCSITHERWTIGWENWLLHGVQMLSREYWLQSAVCQTFCFLFFLRWVFFCCRWNGFLGFFFLLLLVIELLLSDSQVTNVVVETFSPKL